MQRRVLGPALLERQRLVRDELGQALGQNDQLFDAVLARQGRALDAAKTVTEGLVRAIAEEVASKRNTGSGYGRGGAASPAPSATSITLNKRA